ncbi:hypothetical protein Leryth_013504 [Lithospermum erythrorhizon]|nr:hypothetical protein Leryth_013504 [Lithospermum erythrorhizon]
MLDCDVREGDVTDEYVRGGVPVHQCEGREEVVITFVKGGGIDNVVMADDYSILRIIKLYFLISSQQNTFDELPFFKDEIFTIQTFNGTFDSDDSDHQ